MTNHPPPPDERPPSPPLHQSLWLKVAPEVGPEGSQDEPVEPAPKTESPSYADRAAAIARMVYDVSGSPAEIESLALAHAEGIRKLSLPREPTANDEAVRQLREHIVPDPMPPDDPDFQEVQRAPAPPEPDNPPKGAEAACAPTAPCGRDDATPNDGVVPLDLDTGSDDRFCCALWSNGTFTICTSDGGALVLTAVDTRELLRYVREVLSARVVTPA